jgi:hypothetical protein
MHRIIYIRARALYNARSCVWGDELQIHVACRASHFPAFSIGICPVLRPEQAVATSVGKRQRWKPNNQEAKTWH